MASLRLVPVSGQPIDVVKDQSVVGRDPSCEIVVADGSVSRRHARLERRGGIWWVVDQGSANGTYLNSLRVAEQALKNGQELRFGALAFRVDLKEDPEATVATPIVSADDSATVMATPEPPPAAKPAAPPPIPKPAAPPPLPAAVAAPPSAAAAKERFKAAVPAHTPPVASPVPQMPAGPAPAKKGKSPLVWIGVGCCGCLLLVALFAAVLGGGAFWATKGAADATHAWLGQVRQGQSEAVQAGLSESYRSQVDAQELEQITAAIARSKDATFPGRSVDNDRATMTGVLTGGGPPQPVVIRLVKEAGAWKVDGVTLAVE
jgi:predicted component of type VI protein secretion system